MTASAVINTHKKLAMLIVSFGTSYPDAIIKNIEAVEKRIAAAYPQYIQRRAFTSGMIIKKLKDRDHFVVDNPDAALTKLAHDGYTDIVVVPLHILHGFEYDELQSVTYQHITDFATIRTGRPILSSDQDYDLAIEALKQQLPAFSDNQAAILMGHGTDHFSDASY